MGVVMDERFKKDVIKVLYSIDRSLGRIAKAIEGDKLTDNETGKEERDIEELDDRK